jgi:uncharacterized membrane protein
MERMILSLRPDATQQAALAQLIKDQQDPASPSFHQWLTPETFAERFGVSENDVLRVENWLRAHGMLVEEVIPGRTAIVFSGTAETVEEAFHTPIRAYLVNGETHYANSSDPQIPQALAEVVNGPVALHNFYSKPSHIDLTPQYTRGNSAHFLAPADWNVIYDVGPLQSQGLDGTGQSIAVLGRADILLTDIEAFRSEAGLPAKDPQVITNGTDPGFPGCDDEMESTLDVEWAGAIAQNATIKFVTSKSTTTDGINLSALYAVTNNVAPIITLSYGLCESAVGTAGNTFWNNLWAEAAGQGQSVFVSSMDDGAAGCDNPDDTTATQGKAVSGLCTTASNTCVGGTLFNDKYNPSTYWAPTDGAGMASALSYIPEVAWNESGAAGEGLLASGGGVSTLYPKPSWQVAPGVPADGHRDIPDMALTAALNDAYLIQFQGSQAYVGGTSAATPSMASVVALVMQNYGGKPLGNINPVLYGLASAQYSNGGTAIFHDITSGNNSVPGLTGYSAGTGYDLVTGLGSVDAQLLVNHWHDADAGPNLQLNIGANTLSVAAGASGTIPLSVSVSGGLSAAVNFSVKGLPAKLTAAFTPSTLAAPGSGSTSLKLTAATGVTPGIYPLTVSATSGSLSAPGGAISRTVDLSVTVGAVPGITLTPSLVEISVPGGNSGKITLTTAATGGFKGAVALTVTGMPSKMTTSFSSATIASPGAGTSTLTIASAAGIAHGNYVLAIKATSGSVTAVTTIMVDVPDFVVDPSATSVTIAPSGSGQVSITTVPISSFSSAIAFSVKGLPAGVTASFSPTSIAAPGLGSTLLTFTATASAAASTATATVTMTGGEVTHTQAIALTVKLVPSFTLVASATTLNVPPGTSGTVSFTSAAKNGFSSAVSFTLGGIMPTGVNMTFTPTSIAAPGSGKTTLTIPVPASLHPGTYQMTMTATGGGVTQVAAFTLNIPSFVINSSNVSVGAGASMPVTVTISPQGGFNAAVAFTVSGLPTGVTGKFVPTSIAAGGSTTTLTLTATSATKAGQWSPVITGTGGGVTQTHTFTLTTTIPAKSTAKPQVENPIKKA